MARKNIHGTGRCPPNNSLVWARIAREIGIAICIHDGCKENICTLHFLSSYMYMYMQNNYCLIVLLSYSVHAQLHVHVL